MKLTLAVPVVLKDAAGGPDDVTTELVFREKICAGDMRGIKLANLGDMLTEDVLKIANRLTGKPDLVLYGLGPADLMEVARIVGDFLLAGKT